MLRAIVQLLKVLTIAVTALLVATGGARVFALAVDRATPDDVGEPVEIAIAEGDDADTVADKLADAGLIRSKLLFTGQMRLNSLAPKPNTYTLTKGMTIEQIMDRVSGAEQPELAQGGDEAEESAAEVGAGQTVKVTIPEGKRLEEIAAIAEEAGIEGGAEAFMKAIEEVDRSQYDFLADLPANAPLEGFLYPDTYDFVTADPAYNVVLMLNNFDTKVTPEMRARAGEMQLSLYEVLTFASIVEREAQLAQERPQIADVYLNRYTDPEWPSGLEADPTIQYAVGTPEEWWPDLNKQKDLLQTETAYNTYKNQGLPPTPICNPGVPSIQAVLYPAGTTSYFFVATGEEDGSHYFANTKEEHDANVLRYQERVAQQ